MKAHNIIFRVPHPGVNEEISLLTMPAASVETGFSAFKQVVNNLDDLEESAGADERDIDFLKNFLLDEKIQNLVLAHDKLEETPIEAENNKSLNLQVEALKILSEHSSTNENAAELWDILKDNHVQSLLLAHDEISKKNFDEVNTFQLDSPPPPVFSLVEGSIRLVRIRKNKNEPLGIIVKLDENNELVVSRIMNGSLIAKQGLLHEGDIIKEFNGTEVHTPAQLMDNIKNAEEGIFLTIIPNMQRQSFHESLFIKTHFNYDPMRDRLIPCKEAGLPFKDGDILEILSQNDANWWQARKVDSKGSAGIIPSRSLEEKRKAFVCPEYDNSKSFFCGLRRKKKVKYSTKNNKDFDACDLMIYEEVIKMPQFQRKTLVLVGATGVGRRSLKERLIKNDPRLFAAAMPHTSRAPRDGEKHGQGYFFMEREVMEEEIRNEKFLEHGEYNGNLYGTKIETILDVINSSKMCVLDVNPTSLKILKTAEFLPFIVFMAAPSADVLREMHELGKQARGYRGRMELKTEEDFLGMVDESMQIEQVYKSYFDLIIINDDFNHANKTAPQVLIKGF
ncbi:MAGUK p55 subfamily member 6-like [Octopus vulgaris]|uniref:MAGUK p55 subfamily member 6-like n=1 Tax=Octopus vulgaris TaxID=6645 RepID=A0AA36AMD7_OCTVU|nr:MAGUK p55 subfamily member 6-like [Octopus vulgaris]